jgi:predicted AAA+ superfamily ATPase
MAMNNIERVQKTLGLLGPALNTFITATLASDLNGKSWVDLLRAKDAAKGAAADKAYNADDVQNGLRMLTDNIPNSIKKGWYPFDAKLSRVQKSYAEELKDVRNRAQHFEPFSNDEAQRALDTAELFLRAIGAPIEAEQVRKIRLDLRRVASDREDSRAARTLGTADVRADNLPPWREVISPHPDVASDNFNAAEFAADLHTVAQGGEAGEYSDPVQFFERTYLTEGLRDLIQRNVARMTGDMNASPVVNLQTNFGGGKTHSMLALWHLASSKKSSEFPDEVAALARPLDVLPTGLRRVALVGNQMEPATEDTRDGRPNIRTMWGALAWQLGGQEAYDVIAASDRASTNPGASLRELFSLYSPAVILIDEWVAYARQLITPQELPSGSFDTQFTFAQTLTEAAKAVSGIQVVISIPASYDNRIDSDNINDEEVGGENGREALARLKSIVGRTADHWLPANPQESFEIVRRRIFVAPDGDTLAKISSISKALVEYYRKYHSDFPGQTVEPSYADRIKQCYPIHPELFDRLYEDWSTMHRFQRTRGVLRMMNRIVGTLWRSEDAAPFIMPGLIPLETDSVITEITQYLDDGWRPILTSDVAGESSAPRNIDQQNEHLGRRRVARRLAKTIFMDATPTLHTAHKGVDKQRIFLGTAMPGDVPGNFHSALDHLANNSTYLYTDAGRYWYDTQANTTRAARDHAENLPKADVWAEVERRLELARRTTQDRSFVGIHVCPSSTGDVPDEPATRLVIVPTEYTHTARGANTSALEWVRNCIEHRGTANRTYKNALIFLAVDDKRARELDESVRQFLAWRYVKDNAENLGLGGQQTRQAQDRMTKANTVVDGRLLDTFTWAIAASQPAGPTYILEAFNAGGTTNDLIARTATRMVEKSQLSMTRSSTLISMDLTGNNLAPIWERGHISVGELYSLYATYPYLARLKDRDALVDGLLSVYLDTTWQINGFGFAAGFDESTREYVDIHLPSDAATPQLNDDALIVKPDLALAQRDRDAARIGGGEPGEEQHGGNGGTGGVPGGRTGTGGTNRDVARMTRYFASTTLDADFPARDFSTIQQEVLANLSALSGTNVDVRIEISAANPNGFDDSLIRTVRENASTLGFEQSEFDIS